MAASPERSANSASVAILTSAARRIPKGTEHTRAHVTLIGQALSRACGREPYPRLRVVFRESTEEIDQNRGSGRMAVRPVVRHREDGPHIPFRPASKGTPPVITAIDAAGISHARKHVFVVNDEAPSWTSCATCFTRSASSSPP